MDDLPGLKRLAGQPKGFRKVPVQNVAIGQSDPRHGV